MEQDFNAVKKFWCDRFSQRGEATVGHQGQDYRLQTARIETYLRKLFPVGTYFQSAVDFGSGWGRMLPYLSELCGHVWACDIVPNVLAQAQAKSAYATPCLLEWPYRLPVGDKSMDFAMACLVLQHVVNDALFQSATAELRRVLKPGATVVLIDNAMDNAYHVKARTPEQLAAALGLQANFRAERITINTRPSDHWLIFGVKTP